jgi:hypothetical protein
MLPLVSATWATNREEIPAEVIEIEGFSVFGRLTN